MNKKNNELNILAIDTSSNICGVAVKTGNTTVVYNERTGYQHEEVLFVKIVQCLKKAKININDIQKIAVSNGPGSYTGLRIGVACALGLSVKNNIPIVYINTLAQIAYGMKRKYDYILPIIDAKANRVYTALFDKNIKRITNDEIIDVDILLKLLEKYIIANKKQYNICIVGDGIDVYEDKFINMKKEDRIYIVEKKVRYNNAYNLCELSLINKPDKNVSINYMQPSQAERNYKKGTLC